MRHRQQPQQTLISTPRRPTGFSLHDWVRSQCDVTFNKYRRQDFCESHRGLLMVRGIEFVISWLWGKGLWYINQTGWWSLLFLLPGFQQFKFPPHIPGSLQGRPTSYSFETATASSPTLLRLHLNTSNQIVIDTSVDNSHIFTPRRWVSYVDARWQCHISHIASIASFSLCLRLLYVVYMALTSVPRISRANTPMGNGYVATSHSLFSSSSLIQSLPLSLSFSSSEYVLMQIPDLRRNNRLPLRHHSTPIPNPIHGTNPARLHVGHDTIHPLDRAIWVVWEYVYQGTCRGESWDWEDEECGVGWSGECVALAWERGGHGGVLVEV